jgi:sec-independent protein translocase protein TatC
MASLKNDVELTFWDHLEELRWVLVRSVVAVIGLGVFAFLNKTFIFDHIFLAPRQPDFISNQLLCKLGHWIGSNGLCLNQTPMQIVNYNMAGQFNMHFYIAFISGLVIAAPYIFFEFWRFVRPALNTKERKSSRGAVIVCTLLFYLGILFGYFIVLPFTIDFFNTYQVSNQVINTISLSSYINNIISISFSLGIVFEVPIIVYFLTRIGLITPAFMRRSRKIVLVILLTIAAIITPPDVFSQVMVTIPLVILYELSIFVSASVYKKMAI